MRAALSEHSGAVVSVTAVVGTRPEFVKMAPVISRMQRHPGFAVRVVFTAQHREMLDQMAAYFGIRSDCDLDIMRPDQALNPLLGRLLAALDEELAAHRPDVVLAQGDTTTVLAAALASFHRGVKFAHLEAGLRTADRLTPFPEESNRRLVSQLADLHFAPTEGAQRALLQSGIAPESVYLTGNTVVDALLESLAKKPALPIALPARQRLVLLTLHRRESFGSGVQQVLRAARELVESDDSLELVYPVHPNPHVQREAYAALAERPRIHLLPAQDYPSFVALMGRASLILSDSGGVQEEAPSLGVPVLILRDTTERPEAVAAGTAELVGTDGARILAAARAWLNPASARRLRAWPRNPFGDGHAAERVVALLLRVGRAPVREVA